MHHGSHDIGLCPKERRGHQILKRVRGRFERHSGRIASKICRLHQGESYGTRVTSARIGSRTQWCTLTLLDQCRPRVPSRRGFNPRSRDTSPARSEAKSETATTLVAPTAPETISQTLLTVPVIKQRDPATVTENAGAQKPRAHEIATHPEQNAAKTKNVVRDWSPEPPPTLRQSRTKHLPAQVDLGTDPKRGYAAVMDKVRKWSVRFVGLTCPLVFMDRVEELGEVYGIPRDWLPRTMPELLKSRALTWHRNNNKRWQTWPAFKEDFLRIFLPPPYFEHLEDTIRGHFQQTQEQFNDYVIALLDLMRPTSYTEQQKLERIYRNSRQEFQFHIKRSEFDSLDTLLLLPGDYEEVMRQGTPNNAPNRLRPTSERNRQVTTKTTTPANNNQFDPKTGCRRCGPDGHFANGCRNPRRYFY